MFKICTCVVMACAGVAVAGGVDGTLRLDQTPYSAGNGGEFQSTPLTGFVGITGLFSDINTISFQTYCLESHENFQPGDIFSAVINTGAVQGGVGGFDPLDDRSAYLYTLFRTGTLPGYDYGAGRTASAAALQDAFWFIEGEGGANNAFVALADAAVLSGSWSGIGDVRVLNLYTAAGELAQDQLTMIPAPGSALLVMSGLAAATRRRRR